MFPVRGDEPYVPPTLLYTPDVSFLYARMSWTRPVLHHHRDCCGWCIKTPFYSCFEEIL